MALKFGLLNTVFEEDQGGIAVHTDITGVRWDTGSVLPDVNIGELIVWQKGFGTSENYQGAKNNGLAIYDNGINDIRRGQQFTVGTTSPNTLQTITQVTVGLRKSGNPTGNLLIEIYDVDGGGDPTGAPIAVATYTDVTSLTGTNTDYTLQFASPLNIQPSTMYAVTIRDDDTGVMASGNDCITDADNAGTYTGGHLLSTSDGGGSWSQTVGKDLYFILAGTGDFVLFNSNGVVRTLAVSDL